MADHGGARSGAGRREKPKVVLSATKGIATEVLSMDGRPDHKRVCKCGNCVEHRKSRCKCVKVHEQELPEKCTTFAEHRICHCEHCGWWESLLATDLRLRKETRQYLTDRRDGKPAQGVFIGDTRESKVDVDFGDILMPAAPDKPGTAGKPN